MFRRRLILPAVCWAGLLATSTQGADPPAVDFNRDVMPILSNRCFKCHGPATQKGGVRLDSLVLARKKDAVVPGKPGESLLVEKITADDDDDRMPPVKAGPRLTPEQITVLKQWIASGAVYAPHWSYVPPKRPAVPMTSGWSRNPIDSFIEARLTAAKIKPSPEADRATLIRRVTLDLTGLLPTAKELDDFVADKTPDAYEKVVDRLLASPHFGERFARYWLDLARYADSNGYSIDSPRSIWPWRDWVIRAYNADMPFDDFTRWQLAGDLLPSPSTDQLVATGFQRNTGLNEEGGADPEQFRVERTIDRTNTIGAVWLGLTVGCCQCHDHKFDPLTQKDYYSLYAFFNSCDEPTLPVGASAEVERQVNELRKKKEDLDQAGKTTEANKVAGQIRRVLGRTPTTLILRERKPPRETFVHIRGDFLRHGDPVMPAVPQVLANGIRSDGKRLSRLDLANWLVSKDNPLTARVVVNRNWQYLFGKGLVGTENDFGMQGSLPTHPKLLDWLAVEFRENGWSTKKLLRLLVTSATYRQSSTARPELNDVDADNKLLARQSRLRLDAEIIRDAALCASGMMCSKIGGRGVYPPQPTEVFSFTQKKQTWIVSKGEDRYRRGIYTFIFRQSQHPLLTTFDGAEAQVSCTRRNRSDTPLQALHLANDPVFVELADGLGKRLLKDGPADDAGKIDYAFRLCFSRLPSESERNRVLKYLADQSGPPETKWAAVARVLMNLDEFITRE
ncbi:MAG TPA: PSD1 and planctomycete cytochrome C domain-containing protein [Fimbriiglobus sp.]|jgi:hypothetical protein